MQFPEAFSSIQERGSFIMMAQTKTTYYVQPCCKTFLAMHNKNNFTLIIEFMWVNIILFFISIILLLLFFILFYRKKYLKFHYYE
jgi:hypothetical protein